MEAVEAEIYGGGVEEVERRAGGVRSRVEMIVLLAPAGEIARKQ